MGAGALFFCGGWRFAKISVKIKVSVINNKKMKNLFFKKGDTNWLGVVLVSALIGALTSWVIMFISDSVLEISAPDSLRMNGNAPAAAESQQPAFTNIGNTGICGSRISGRQPGDMEKQQCQVAGGDWLCTTQCVDTTVPSPESGCQNAYCECVCPR
jgi:hypothetical protein